MTRHNRWTWRVVTFAAVAAILASCGGGSGESTPASDTSDRTLTVTNQAPGSGTVLGPGIACGADCTATFASGTAVTLTAGSLIPGAHATWAGCDTAAGDSCTVRMDTDRVVSVSIAVGTGVSVQITGLPATSNDGNYVVTWGCTSNTCTTSFSLQEDGDSTFASPVTYSFVSGETSATFVNQSSGSYCYRVAPSGQPNWSAPRCVVVTRSSSTSVTLPVLANNCVALNSQDSVTANTVFRNCYPKVGLDASFNPAGPTFVAYASLVKFDTTRLTGKTIDSATLRLTVLSAGVGDYPKNLMVGAIASPWSATAITWNGLASLLFYSASWSSYPYPTRALQVYDVEFRTTVQNWANGAYSNFGLILESTSYASPGEVISYDAYDFYVPTLTVTYH